jgi:hypothetical protein
MSLFNEFDLEVKKIEYEIEKIFNTSYSLEEIGMFFLSKKIRCNAENLEKSVQNIKKAIHTKIDDDYKQAQQASANVLNACLSGIKLNKNNP